MSTFSDWNGPQTGMSANAMIKFADAYETMKREFETHKNQELTNSEQDPHKVKAYIDERLSNANNLATNNNNAIKCLLGKFAGINNIPVTISDIQSKINAKIGETDLVSFVKGLADTVAEMQAELNKLSLLQFDNVPVGAGIRWYQDTLPEDGTYVWANGQTLYGVNQNFPDLVSVWNLTSSDNIKVPCEDHTIFKVRKATRKIEPIQHAYVEEASDTTDTINALATKLESVQGILSDLTEQLAQLQNP